MTATPWELIQHARHLSITQGRRLSALSAQLSMVLFGAATYLPVEYSDQPLPDTMLECIDQALENVDIGSAASSPARFDDFLLDLVHLRDMLWYSARHARGALPD